LPSHPGHRRTPNALTISPHPRAIPEGTAGGGRSRSQASRCDKTGSIAANISSSGPPPISSRRSTIAERETLSSHNVSGTPSSLRLRRIRATGIGALSGAFRARSEKRRTPCRSARCSAGTTRSNGPPPVRNAHAASAGGVGRVMKDLPTAWFPRNALRRRPPDRPGGEWRPCAFRPRAGCGAPGTPEL
jgi:hypothetical protein